MRKTVYLGLGAVTVVLLLFLFARSNAQSQPKRYTVKLYSAERVMGTWEALDYGKVDGQTLEFTVGNRSFPTRVRICGTYSVEEHD